MATIYTYTIRDNTGKLVTSYDTYTFGEIPAQVRGSLYTPEGNLKEGYTQSLDERKTAAKSHPTLVELEGRRSQEQTKIKELETQRDASLAQVNTRRRYVAQTTNNPFISAGGREISRRKSNFSTKRVIGLQSDIDRISQEYGLLAYNPIIPESAPIDPDKLATDRYAESVNRENLANDVIQPVIETEADIAEKKRKEEQAKKPANIRKQELDIEAYKSRNTQPVSAGFVIETPAPRNMTRVEQTAYNKSLINATLDAKKKLTDTERGLLNTGRLRITLGSKTEKIKSPENYEQSDTGFPQVTNPNVINSPFQSIQANPSVQKQTLQKASQVYVVTDKNGNVQRYPEINDDEIRALQKIGSSISIETTRYTVKDPSGRERTFNTKQSADKFAKSYGQQQGSILPSGIGEAPKQQGPNLKEDVFFVGANAQGYVTTSQRKIEPRLTATDFFGNNAYTMRLDKIYETNKPIAERDDKNRALFFTNREIGELSSPILNRLVEAKDVFAATPGFFRGEKTFTSEPGLFGIPQTVPVKRTAKIETTLDRLVEGKPVNLQDKNERFSLYGSTFGIAGELYAFGKGVQGGTKTVESVDLLRKTGSLTKVGAVSKAEKLLNEGLIAGTKKTSDNSFLITIGSEARGGAKITSEIKPTLFFEKVKDRVTPFFSRTPKEVNVLQSGEKIQEQILAIDKQIEKLKPFANRSRFDDKLVKATEDKIQELAKKRETLANKQGTILPGEAKYPVSIVEFNAPITAELPTGNIVTQIGKAKKIAETKIGSELFVEGTVPRQNILDLGLKELPRQTSDEFGIFTSTGQTNAVYRGVLTESNLAKLSEAENLGLIKTIAQGKSVPLEYLLKGKTDLLRGYAGAKTLTTKIGKPDEAFDFFYHGTSSKNAKKILKQGLIQDSFLSNEIQLSKIYGQFASKEGGSIIEYKIPKTARKIDYYNVKGYGKGTGFSLQDKARKEGYDIINPYVGQKNEFILLKSNLATPTRIINVSKEGKLTSKIIGDKQSKNIFDIFKRTPTPPQKADPVLSLFTKTGSDSIRTPTEFGLVNKGKITSGESRGVTGIGSKSLGNFAQDILKPVAEKTARKNRPFNFDSIGTGKGTGGSSGKGDALSLDDALGTAKSYLGSRKNIVTPPQDILFSGPRGLLPQYHGVVEPSVFAYPPGTPEKIKNQLRIQTGLEPQSRQKQSQSGEGDYFKRFGLEMFRQTKKEFEKQGEISINIQTPREGQKGKTGIIPMLGFGLGITQVPVSGTRLDQTPIQGTRLDQTPILTTDLITDPFPITTTEEYPPIGSGFRIGVFGTAFPGFGGGPDDRQRRKRGKKKYIVSSIDPLTPGSIITAGVAQQQVSRSKSIYGRLDIQLGKARRKNQPKNKKSRHAIPDPFG